MQCNTTERSNVLIYLTGHGGDGFLKFNDYEEVSSHDIADAVEQMHQQRRYNEMLLIVDTCQVRLADDVCNLFNVEVERQWLGEPREGVS
jgi:glycosylphosphatidylinositol transamidase (GPIT) subunit GPI8